MNNEFKWICIAGAFFFVAMFGALAISEMAKANCKIEAMHNKVPIEQAESFCR